MSDDHSVTRSYRQDFGGRLFGLSDLNVATSAVEGLPDEQKSSPVRRTFILLIFFELVLIFVLWIVYLRTLGNFMDQIKQEVINMTFTTSLFDIQIISAGRFIILEVAYGAFLTSYRWPSVVSTTGTTVYIIVKCTEFSFTIKQASSGLCYTVLILPMVMAWISTFFLECRVLPQERMAQQISKNYQRMNPHLLEAASGAAMEEDDEAVVASHFASVRKWATRAATMSHYTRSIYASPEGSLVDDTESLLSTNKYPNYGATEAPVDVAALLAQAGQLRCRAWHAYDDAVWLQQRSTRAAELGPGPNICCTSLPGYRHKIYRLDGLLNSSAKTIYKDLVKGFEFTPVWNQTISSARCLQSFPHEKLDIVHSVVKDVLGGLIKSRDFVMLRAWGVRGDTFYVASSSVTHPNCPPSVDCIRAEQLINAVFLQPTGSPNTSYMVLITGLDIKGWFPGNVIEMGVKASLTSFFQSLQERATSLNAANAPITDANWALPSTSAAATGALGSDMC